MAPRKKKEDAKTKAFVVWLRRTYWIWQEKTGELDNISKFAKWIDPGISQQNMSRWLNSIALPTGENVHKLAQKLGPEIYEILDITPPVNDPRLRDINRVWEELPEALKASISDQVGRSKARESGDGQETEKSKRGLGNTN